MFWNPIGQFTDAVEKGIYIVELTILKESAIQKPTKFHGPHVRRAGSTVYVSYCHPRLSFSDDEKRNIDVQLYLDQTSDISEHTAATTTTGNPCPRPMKINHQAPSKTGG